MTPPNVQARAGANTPLSEQGRVLQSKLRSGQEDAITRLKAHIAGNEAGVEVVRVCLECYYDRIWKLPRKARPAVLRQDRLGGITLKWLWQNHMQWISAVHENEDFVGLLTYLLVAEDLGDYVFQWILSETTSEGLPSPSPDRIRSATPDRWRGSLLRKLVTAHIVLDTSACADPALKTLFRLLDLKDARRAEGSWWNSTEPIIRISIRPAAVKLNKAFKTGEYTRTDPQLYARFIQLYSDHPLIDFGTAEREKARLYLNFPGKPSPDFALRYLRKQVSEHSFDELRSLLPPLGWPRLDVEDFFKTLTEVLEKQERKEDMEWVKVYQRHVFGKELGPRERHGRRTLRPEKSG